MSELTKVSMNLSIRSLRNIDEINQMLDQTNKTKAVSAAIEIAKTIIGQIEDGNKLIIRDKAGNDKEVKFVYC